MGKGLTALLSWSPTPLGRKLLEPAMWEQFREHSVNIQGAFREHSGSILAIFREH
jgi:hypothetical protein